MLSKTHPVVLYSLFWYHIAFFGSQRWFFYDYVLPVITLAILVSALSFISERWVKQLQPETEHLVQIRLNWDNVSPLPLFEPEVKTRFYVTVMTTLRNGAIFALTLRETTKLFPEVQRVTSFKHWCVISGDWKLTMKKSGCSVTIVCGWIYGKWLFSFTLMHCHKYKGRVYHVYVLLSLGEKNK